MIFRWMGICILGVLSANAFAAGKLATGNGRILATGAVTTIDGTAGGGIVPMAILAGYGTNEQHGGVVSASRLNTDDFALNGFAAAWSWHNRVEFSVARQTLDAGIFKIPDVEELRTNNYGVKARLFGDVLYTTVPQVSIGAMYRESINRDIAALGGATVPEALGAKSNYGTDYYLAATKVFIGGPFGRNWLVNGVVRSTRANQGGLLGFGGDLDEERSTVAEGSIGVFLNKHWLIGGEYREQPENLTFLHQDDWKDLFIAWFPNKQWSITAALVDLGEVSTAAVPYENDDRDQRGAYLSITGAF
jgi:hypothetical protein